MADNDDGGKEHDVNLVFVTAMAAVVIVVSIALLYLAVVRANLAAWSVAAVGILTFLAVLFILNYLSGKTSVEKGEVGHAIAAALVVVYFAIFAMLVFAGITPTDPGLAERMIGQFTAIIQVVIAFYFGAEAAKFASDKWEGAKKEQARQSVKRDEQQRMKAEAEAPARIAEANAREREAELELARLGFRAPPAKG